MTAGPFVLSGKISSSALGAAAGLQDLEFVCINTHMDSRHVIRILEAEGWEHRRTTGSHWHFVHPTRPGLVTVPHPKRDLPVGTIKSIERQSGVKFLG